MPNRPLTMDASRCIAYLSYTSGQQPAVNMQQSMGTWLYGCDICQNVCPANAAFEWDKGEVFPERPALTDIINLSGLVAMDEETYQTVLQPRFPYLGHDELWRWKCNAIRAMGNESPEEYEPVLRAALDDPHPNVRELARWALEMIKIK